MYSPSEMSGPSAAKHTRIIESHGMSATQGSLPGGLTARWMFWSSVVTVNQLTGPSLLMARSQPLRPGSPAAVADLASQGLKAAACRCDLARLSRDDGLEPLCWKG